MFVSSLAGGGGDELLLQPAPVAPTATPAPRVIAEMPSNQRDAPMILGSPTRADSTAVTALLATNARWGCTRGHCPPQRLGIRVGRGPK